MWHLRSYFLHWLLRWCRNKLKCQSVRSFWRTRRNEVNPNQHHSHDLTLVTSLAVGAAAAADEAATAGLFIRGRRPPSRSSAPWRHHTISRWISESVTLDSERFLCIASEKKTKTLQALITWRLPSACMCIIQFCFATSCPRNSMQ